MSRTPRHPAPSPLIRWLPWVLLALLMPAGATTAWAETVVGNGKIASEVRSTGSFNAIAMNGGIELKLRQGGTPLVVVHGDSNLLPLVETVIEADRSLQLRWKRGASVRSQSPVYVEVVAPQVQAVSSAGSGAIDIDTLKVPRLTLAFNGSGDLRAKGLATDDLAISIAGSSDLKLAGRATRLTIEVRGSGDIDASQLRSDDVTVGIAGSGDVAVHAERTLAVSIAGSGDVVYSGSPSVQRSVAGSGSVRKR
ncbi:MAG TPA: head GIN domain-containing protein, partial [Burkholderiaceae bacterium]|nr:head GIN domain-containing protein [Burkholderiaceae bacterium]